MGNLKTYNTNLRANLKSVNTNLSANIKTLNTNDATTAPAPPAYTGGRYFDGTNDSIISNSMDIFGTPTGLAGWTLQVWIKSDGIQNAANCNNVFQGGSTIAIATMYLDGTLAIYPGAVDWVRTGYVFPTGVWAHLTITYSTGSLIFYINGESVYVATNITGNEAFTTGTGTNNAVGGQGGYNSTLGGAISEMRFFDYEMTPTQVTNTWNTIVSYTGSGLRFNYHCDEDSGTQLLDSSGRDVHLGQTTIVGTTKVAGPP